MIKGDVSWSARTADWLVWLFFAGTTFIAIVPIFPQIPSGGLTPSWEFALNQAVAQGLAFGRDVVFTFGPYASVYTRVYHPGTDSLMLWGALLFWLSYVSLLFFVVAGRESYWLLLFYGLFISITYYAPDAVFFSLPLLVALATYRITLPANHARGLPIAVPPTRWLALMFVPLGLLPLIKGTLLVLTAVIACMCGVMLYRRKQYFLACSAIGVPPLSAFVLWLIAGQPISALPQYVFNMVFIIAGYSEAMALEGRLSEIVAYTVAGTLLLAYIKSCSAYDPDDSRIFLLTCYTFLVFVAFKAGFVRHDGHVVIASTTVAIVGLLSTMLFSRTYGVAVLALTLLMWGYVDRTYVGTPIRSMHSRVTAVYSSAWAGLRERLASVEGIAGRYRQALDKIRYASPLPSLSGTSDIYSYEQSSLLASGNTWAPRPVLQSYSAYTPHLARLDEAYFLGENAPLNVIFRVETIDGRLPALDDGLIWPILMGKYSVKSVSGDFAVLRRISEKPTIVVQHPEYEAENQLGEPVLLPHPNRPMYAELRLKPTLVGRVLSLLWKPPHLKLTVTLRGGKQKDYRIVSGMTETGFVLSPLIESTRDFVLFMTTGTHYLTDKLITGLTVTSSSKRPIFWQMTYSLRLSPLIIPERKDIATLRVFDEMIESDRLAMFQRSLLECDGFIDAVNGTTPVPRSLRIMKMLAVDGWTAIAPRSGIVADEVFVTLTSEDGHKIYARTRTTPRTDVKKYFGQPNMPDIGFTVVLDVSKLRGGYVLGLSRLYKQSLQECKQFRVPIQIEN